MKGADYWIHKLCLSPHPEGGHYAETYRSSETIRAGALPSRFSGDRSLCTAIYYLLQGDDFSSFHRILSDEMWHFYTGTALLIHCLARNSSYHAIRLGNDPEQGQTPQAVVPAGTWFAAELMDTSSFALTGCTVAPGFDFSDFTPGAKSELSLLFPESGELIDRLTRD